MPKQPKPQDAATPTELRQIAALPYRRRNGLLEICLVTTRETRRWTLPKGWPMKRLTDAEAARLEAEQEAGVGGRIGKKPIGSFRYFKRMNERFELITVDVYPLAVSRYLDCWKEQAARDVTWFPIASAAGLLDEPEAQSLLLKIKDKGALLDP